MKEMTEKELRGPVGGKNYAICRMSNGDVFVGEIQTLVADDNKIKIFFRRFLQCTEGSHGEFIYRPGTASWDIGMEFGGPVSRGDSSILTLRASGDLILITENYDGGLAFRAHAILSRYCSIRPRPKG